MAWPSRAGVRPPTLQTREDAGPDEPTRGCGPVASHDDPVLLALTAEASALRRQLEVLTERMAGVPPGRLPRPDISPDAHAG